MGAGTLGSLGKLSQRSHACLAILFVWSLYINLVEWMPPPTGWLGAVVVFSRLFVDPLIVLLVAGRLLEARTTPDRASWDPVLSSASRLYLRAFLICILLVIAAYFVRSAFSLDLKADNLLARWKNISAWLPLSVMKILWVSALVARGRGVVKSAGRAVQLILRSRLVLAACVAWALALYLESLYSPAELQGQSLLLAIGWLVATSALVAAVLRFVYTVALDQYQALFGVESREYAPIAEAGPEIGVVSVAEGSISLWWTFVSFIPLLSIVAFLKGRRAARRLHWRSIRAVLAYSFGLFFTLVHLLVLIGANLPGPSDPQIDYGFLSEADASVVPQVKLLATGEFQQAHDQLMKPDSRVLEGSWSRLTALAIAESNLGQADEALAYFEKASGLRPERNQFHYLYGRVLLDNGQRSKAEQHFLQARKLGMNEEVSAPLLNLARTTYDPPRWVKIVWSIVILMILFTVHEFAHAYAAFKLGDDTAAEQGRLTLNPIAHLDLIGSVLLPGLLLWRGSDLIFGWARPVPVTPEKFQDPKRDHMRVSFAGPAANLIVTMIAALLLLLVLIDVRLLSPDARSLDLAMPSASVSLSGSGLPAWIPPVIAFLKEFAVTGLILACFNLIPMPPLDGSWILSGLVSESFQAKLEAFRPYASIVFLVLIFTPAFDYLLAIPVGLFWAGGTACFALMGFS